MLHSEPSFCIYNTVEGVEEENGNQELELERSVSAEDKIDALGSDEFSFGRSSMGLIEEDGDEENIDGGNGKDEELNGSMKDLEIKGELINPPVHPALGLQDFDEIGDFGEYYLRMLREEPSNPLYLRNYAQFLQSHGDLYGAQEYYFCATLADPRDGEILMQYAKLVWELHKDREKASSYFERAASAASDNSHVLAAYASFLWELDENEEEDSLRNVKARINEESGNEAGLPNLVLEELERSLSPPLHLAAGLRFDAAGFGVGISSSDSTATSTTDAGIMEEYYKWMVEENPCNPLFLRNYAKFLYQCKKDLEGAEEYYSRAALADPTDGEIISQYARLVWQLHHDKDKATSYFELAVRASPGNSNVLAAYARFLWEAEGDDGEKLIQKNHGQVSNLEGAMSGASA